MSANKLVIYYTANWLEAREINFDLSKEEGKM